MSTNGDYGWKPRKIQTFPCPSGKKVQIRKPGPEFTLKAGRNARTFSRALESIRHNVEQNKDADLSEEEKALGALADLGDEELEALLNYARELVCAMLISPKLVRHPNPDRDEVGPDDIGDDFWALFNHHMLGYPDVKIPVGPETKDEKQEEVEVSDLESFRSEPSLQGIRADREGVRETAEQSAGN